MCDEPGGHEIDCDAEPTDWNVRTGPRNNPTQKERITRSNPHTVPRLVHPLHCGHRTNT